VTRLRLADAETQAPTLDEIRQWPATCDIAAASRAFGVSKSHGYELHAQGCFPARTIKVGGRIRVITADLIKVLGGDVPP
jgi:hypothetical protein